MSNTERAPEPTMEDILASIRRIITDDDASQDQTGTPAKAVQSEDEGLEGEADNQIIDDIARVLSAGGDAPANEDEEIMDLTAELGGLELVEDEPAELPEPAEAVDAAPEFVDVREEIDEVFELDEVLPDTPEPEADVFETLESAEAAEPPALPQEAMIPEMPPVPPQMPEEAIPAEPKLTASEEAASALERAIAALKAGQSPSAAAPLTPSFEAPVSEAPFAGTPEPELPPAEAQTGMSSLPGDFPMAVPMDEQTPEEGTHLDPEADMVPDFEPEVEVGLEPEPILEAGEGEAELTLTDMESDETFVLEDAEPEKEPFWPPQPSAEPAPEPAVEAAPLYIPPVPQVTAEALAVQTNGAVSHEQSVPKSLEDSIKDMLRPMLREWLDENMPRMIREELDADALQRGQD
ncbi:DUF2497 domain-containing protein [Methyloceanibacter sp.]|uniref:DUF2497 domain-containing protein n=1 Tax=Methyloceanibacter sp. TaxID=1965321 RepID=UPI002BD5FB0B|nr:DUF2497 domain-containing protein [Methyloceanibacter sp.]HML93502.1 DUF2497 domain-containing protein [Methyloceanibacter sp.]